MGRLLIPLVLIALAFWVVSFVDCAMQPPTRHRGASKKVWVLITVIPVIGGVLWWTIGRAKPDQMSAGAASLAPDDDPSFEQRLAEDRIRKLEEEIALLDMEEAFNMPDAKKPDEDDDADDDDRK
ncbi:MAG TPA: PLD nuclease N-terminal domain-containing protein [Microbacterium sp.]|nr:PLD nuclease N-terminal domain-containing protein [Microbacterium sp.]